MTTPDFSKLTQWYDHRPLRERIVLLVCVFIVLIFLVNLVVLTPFSTQSDVLRGKLVELKADLTLLDAQETVIRMRRGEDPDSENRQQLEILEHQLDEVRQQLEGNIASLVSPREMPSLLKDLLTQQEKLHLLSLENLSPERLELKQSEDGEGVVPTLYRHRLRLEFSGDYLTMVKYLRQLEQLPRAMVWEKVEIETQEYPEATVRLQVFTLSLTEGWIGG
ncbi:MAG: type II secretion system protein GspM [Thermodesulfobacteriota bacterium]|nr:type II secretion system protein GspM [Thermodesulfobacteriota bacterium]